MGKFLPESEDEILAYLAWRSTVPKLHRKEKTLTVTEYERWVKEMEEREYSSQKSTLGKYTDLNVSIGYVNGILHTLREDLGWLFKGFENDEQLMDVFEEVTSHTHALNCILHDRMKQAKEKLLSVDEKGKGE